MDKFRVARTGDEACENWLICFGTDNDDRDYYITTNQVPGSELHTVSGGARIDAELVCRLLNEHFAK